MSKELYIYAGNSDALGHNPTRLALPLKHGEDVFSFYNGTLHQNPKEPLNGHPSLDADGKPDGGSSPIRYFADDLAGATGDQICVSLAITHTGNWHDGLRAWTAADAKATAEKIAPLLADGWHLAGLIIGTPGEADNAQEVRTYGHRFHVAMERYRSALNDSTLPVFLMQTEHLKPNNLSEQQSSLLDALRVREAHISNFDDYAVCAHSNVHWHHYGATSPYHLDVAGEHAFGQMIANTVLAYDHAHLLGI